MNHHYGHGPLSRDFFTCFEFIYEAYYFCSSKWCVIILLTVEYCNGVGKIENLLSIIKTKEQAPSYFVFCDEGFEQLTGHHAFECKDQEWSPPISCKPKIEQNFTTVISRSMGRCFVDQV